MIVIPGIKTALRPILALLFLACLVLPGCFGHRTIVTMTVEVDNSAAVYKIGTDALNNAFAKHMAEQAAANHRQVVVMSTGGETLFVKFLSDTVTLDENSFLGDGQKHVVKCSYRFRDLSGILQTELIVRKSGFVSRFAHSLSSLIGDAKPKDIWPELDDIIQDLCIQLTYELN
jgi:hypothetical protein